MPDLEKLEPLRIVHLLGGLRAFDVEDDVVRIGVNGLTIPAEITRPEYPKLYAVLEQFGVQPIGVEFISSALEMDGSIPRQWVSWRTPKGLGIVFEKQHWSSVRFAEADVDLQKYEIAGKIGTYLRLTDLRLKQISNAYHQTLRAKLKREEGEPHPESGSMFSNVWMEEIEAAIHAYFADAAALRDAIAEAVWHLILKGSGTSVSKMGALLKRAVAGQHPLVDELLKHGDDGGWIKNLTDLRNGLIHDAPVDRSHEHSFCELRAIPHNDGKSLFTLHYPLTTADWGRRVHKFQGPPTRSEEEMKKTFEEYRAFVASSGDALEYAWRTTGHLADLAQRTRIDAGLEAEIPRITPIEGTLKRI